MTTRADLAAHCRQAVADVLTRQERPIAVAGVDAILAPHVLTVTARIRYRGDVARALKLGPELAHAMRYSGPLDVAQVGGDVRLTMTLPPCHRVAPPMPPMLAGLRVAIGYDAKNAPVVVDLAAPSTPHGIIVGATGSGKSVLLEGVALQLARQSSPHDTHLYLCDPQDRAFRRLRDSAHVQATGWDGAQAARVVAEVGRILAARVASGETAPAVVLLADELAALQDDAPGVSRDLVRILTTGRKHNVHLVAASPDASTSLLNPDSAKHFGLRVAGRVASAGDAYRVTGARHTGAESSEHPGDMVVVAPGILARVQVPQPGAGDYLAIPPRLLTMPVLAPPIVSGLVSGLVSALTSDPPEKTRPVINPTHRRVLTEDAYAWITERAARQPDGSWHAPSVRQIAAEYGIRTETAHAWQRAAIAALAAESVPPVPTVPGARPQWVRALQPAHAG